DLRFGELLHHHLARALEHEGPHPVAFAHVAFCMYAIGSPRVSIDSDRARTMASKLSRMSAWRSPGMIQNVSLRMPSTTYSATSSGCTGRRGLPLAFMRFSISS